MAKGVTVGSHVMAGKGTWSSVRSSKQEESIANKSRPKSKDAKMHPAPQMSMASDGLQGGVRGILQRWVVRLNHKCEEGVVDAIFVVLLQAIWFRMLDSVSATHVLKVMVDACVRVLIAESKGWPTGSARRIPSR